MRKNNLGYITCLTLRNMYTCNQCVQRHAYIYVYIYICMYICMCIYIHIFRCMHADVYVHTYTESFLEPQRFPWGLFTLGSYSVQVQTHSTRGLAIHLACAGSHSVSRWRPWVAIACAGKPSSARVFAACVFTHPLELLGRGFAQKSAAEHNPQTASQAKKRLRWPNIWFEPAMIRSVCLSPLMVHRSSVVFI